MSELLVKQDDFNLYRPLPGTLPFSRMESVILRVQRGWLRDVLGRGLYYDVHTNPTTGSNPILLAGGSYSLSNVTIDFYGIKPAICLYAYATYINQADTRLTNSGNKRKKGDQSENATDEMINNEFQKAIGEAGAMMQEAITYLDNNRSSFPLWKGGRPPKTGIRVGVGTQVDYYSEDGGINRRIGDNGNILNRH